VPSHAARERFGLDGKARETSMSAATCEERATQSDSSKRPRPLGCADFSSLRRCWSGTDHRGCAPSSRLGETKNRQQRGMVDYFNRLLGTCDRRVVFGAMVRLDGYVDQFVVSA
jgi:hypothetical protein